MMPVISRNVMSALSVTLSMGIIGLLFAPLLQAQEYPADITRGKGVYQRHCQACHGAGGLGDGPDAKDLKVAPDYFHRFSSILKSEVDMLRIIGLGVVINSMH